MIYSSGGIKGCVDHGVVQFGSESKTSVFSLLRVRVPRRPSKWRETPGSFVTDFLEDGGPKIEVSSCDCGLFEPVPG